MNGHEQLPKFDTFRLRPRVLAYVIITFAFSLVLTDDASGQWFLFGRAQRRYEECVKLYEEKRFNEAQVCIENFIERYPTSRWVEHLQFLDANMQTDVDLAEEKLRRFVQEFPNGPYSDQANLAIGEIYELKGDYYEAERFYSRIYLYFWTSNLRDEAGLRVAKCMLLRGDLEQARSHLEIYLSTHREQPWRSRAKELYADTLLQNGESLKAQEVYKEIISEASSPADVPPDCYLKIAAIYEDNQDYRAAFQTYRQFLNIFPDSLQKSAVERKTSELASILKVDLTTDTRMYVIEAGLFESEQEARVLIGRLKKLGYQAYLVTIEDNYLELLSVRLGPYDSRDSALAAADRLTKETGLDVTLLPQRGNL